MNQVRPSRLRWGWILGACLWGAVVPELAVAQERAPAPVMPSPVPARVTVEVKVIQASSEAGASDPRLASMMGALSRMGFARFWLVDEHAGAMADTEELTLRLPENRRLRVSLVSHDAAAARVRVELISGEVRVLDSTVSINRNRAFFLKVGLPAGGAIILPVGVRY